MHKLISILVFLGLVVPALAGATVHNGTINGDEAQATTCAVGSTSQILGTVSYDDVTGLFSWSYTFGDNAPSFDNGALFMGGTPTLAHFHGPALPGVPAGVQVDTGPANPNVDSQAITPTQGVDLLGELWYLNVHSSNCGGGELRGQVLFPSAVPSFSGTTIGGLAALLMGTAWFAVRRSGARTA